ncbi:hypothetical protein F5Y16DRAFT_98693 [Xylariaceae sp. FL0255]|nr:hypothetical protein F5Y16DRAFT_98693 [Xylariaceae sp. FL0255]
MKSVNRTEEFGAMDKSPQRDHHSPLPRKRSRDYDAGDHDDHDGAVYGRRVKRRISYGQAHDDINFRDARRSAGSPRRYSRHRYGTDKDDGGRVRYRADGDYSPERDHDRRNHHKHESTYRRDHSHRDHHHHSSKPKPSSSSTPHPKAQAQGLPHNARPLSRSIDFEAFRPLFARYLEKRKHIDIGALDDREVRGRWKGFVARWNAGELDEKWYRREEVLGDEENNDRQTRSAMGGRERRSEGARRDAMHMRGDAEITGVAKGEAETEACGDKDLSNRDAGNRDLGNDDDDDDDDEDDYNIYGPTLPQASEYPSTSNSNNPLQTKHGPGIPNLADLTYRDELLAADSHSAYQNLRHERKLDRALQKERLEDLAPRADAGSHDRRLEKRREVREGNAAFAAARSGDAGGGAEMTDGEMYGGGGGGGGAGGGEGGFEEFKKEADHKRSERESRREEIERARREERDERVRSYREREAGTVDMLREIARARFG